MFKNDFFDAKNDFFDAKNDFFDAKNDFLNYEVVLLCRHLDFGCRFVILALNLNFKEK